jgi:hypothetical protein
MATDKSSKEFSSALSPSLIPFYRLFFLFLNSAYFAKRNYSPPISPAKAI